MARIRTIKPEFFTSEDIVELDPLARLLYIALWCESDKEGRLNWKPKTFKMRYFPADNCDIDVLCDALVTRGLVCLYGEGLAYIPSFKNHQHINPRESASVLPNPDEKTARVNDASARVNAPSVTHREEGRKGRECIDACDASAVADKKTSAHAIKFDFSTGAFSNINGQMSVWAKAYPAINLELEINKAAAWLIANPSNRKSNYAKFLTGWFSRTQDKAPAKGGGSKSDLGNYV